MPEHTATTRALYWRVRDAIDAFLKDCVSHDETGEVGFIINRQFWDSLAERLAATVPSWQTVQIKLESGAREELYCLWFTCPHCNHPQVAEGSKFCSECGARIEWSQP